MSNFQTALWTSSIANLIEACGSAGGTGSTGLRCKRFLDSGLEKAVRNSRFQLPFFSSLTEMTIFLCRCSEMPQKPRRDRVSTLSIVHMTSAGIGCLLLGSQILLACQLPRTVASRQQIRANHIHQAPPVHHLSEATRRASHGASAPLRDRECDSQRSQVPLLISGRAGTHISGFRPRDILYPPFSHPRKIGPRMGFP